MKTLYVSASLAEAGIVDDSRLVSTTERHKLALNVPPLASVSDPVAMLDRDATLGGVILEARIGWPTLQQLRIARAALRRGRRAWLYWPAEQAIECLDGRISSAWRLWAFVTAYFAIKRWTDRLHLLVRGPNGPVRKMLGGKTPGEWRLTLRARAVIGALRDRVSPVAFSQPLPSMEGPPLRGTGVYLRLDFWTNITSGGSYGHTCYVAKELAAVTEHFVCFTANRYALLDEFGITQHVMPPPAATSGENTIIDAPYYYYRVLRRPIEALKPAYIYERLVLGNYTGAMLSQELGIPYIVEYNGSELSMLRSFGGSRYIHEDVFLRAEALAFEQATFISVVSDEVRASLLARGVPAAKILVNPNGADLQAYAPALPDEKQRVQRELGFHDGERIVGFSGTFGGWHGIDVLAAAIPKICAEEDRVRFLLIGDGAYKHLVDEAVRRHNLDARVVSVGRVPQAEGARLLKACDLYVSPHSSGMVDSKFFGSPTKLFEYMAMGGGIVASDLEQIGQVLSPALRSADLDRPGLSVTSERAVLCTPGSVDEFITATLGLVRRPDLCVALGRNARQAVADQYSWQRHVARLWAFAAAMPPVRTSPRRRRASFIGRHRLGQVLQQDRPEEPAPPLFFEPPPPIPKPTAEIVTTGDPYKDEAQRQWNNDPVGSQYVREADLHTLEWFLEAERYRYSVYAPWMPETMEFAGHRGEKVLEIGGGMGTDLAQFAKNGAIVTDLDLAGGHLDLAKENFKLRGLHGEFVRHDAERLPFDDNSFDLVYSNGVLHHTPNTQAAVREIHRVLKPGGRAIVMMYAENSLHYWRNLVLTVGLDDGWLRDLSIGEVMSRTVERSDTAGARPLVKVYSRSQLRRLFNGFDRISIVQRQLVSSEVPKILARVPATLLGTLMGWNLIIKARKPPSAAATTVREAARGETAPASARQ